MGVKVNTMQLNFTFAMLALLNRGGEASQATLAAAGRQIDAQLLNKQLSSRIGSWTRVWGPWIQVRDRQDQVAESVSLFIVRNRKRTNEYIISLGVINAPALYNWQQTETQAVSLVKWPCLTEPGSCEQDPVIEGDLARTLELLSNGVQADHVTVRAFLKQQASGRLSRLKVSVTGHGKAAALCTVFALYLAETRSAWQGRNAARLQVYPFGSTSAGNQAFARYYTGKLDNYHFSFTGYRNPLDPAMFSQDAAALRQVPELYGAQVPGTELARSLAAKAAELLAGSRFQAIPGQSSPHKQLVETANPQSLLVKAFTDGNFCYIPRLIKANFPFLDFAGIDICCNTRFFTRVVYEHILAYFVHLNMEELLPHLCGNPLFRTVIIDYFTTIIIMIRSELVIDNLKAEIDLFKLQGLLSSALESLMTAQASAIPGEKLS